MNISKSNRSAVYMLISAVLFSFGGLFVKVCSWSPMSMNAFRNVFAAAVIYAYFKTCGYKFKINAAVLLGGAAYAVTNIFFVAATKLTTAANAIVLQFTVPIFIILFSWIFLKQRPQKRDVAACAFVFFGIILFFYRRTFRRKQFRKYACAYIWYKLCGGVYAKVISPVRYILSDIGRADNVYNCGISVYL